MCQPSDLGNGKSAGTQLLAAPGPQNTLSMWAEWWMEDEVFQEGAGWPALPPLSQTSQCDAHTALGSAHGSRHSRGDLPSSPTAASITYHKSYLLPVCRARGVPGHLQMGQNPCRFWFSPGSFCNCVDARAGLFIQGSCAHPEIYLSDLSWSHSSPEVWRDVEQWIQWATLFSLFQNHKSVRSNGAAPVSLRVKFGQVFLTQERKKEAEGHIYFVAKIATIRYFWKDRMRNKKKYLKSVLI